MHFKVPILTRLLGWIAAFMWLPVHAATQAAAQQSALTSATIYYQNEVILATSAVTMLFGAWLAAYWKPPIELEAYIKRNTTVVNIAAGIAGGICAFLYMLHTSQKLTVLHPVWVFGISFATPLALQVAAPIVVRVLSKYLNRFDGSGGNSDDKQPQLIEYRSHCNCHTVDSCTGSQ